MYSVSSGKSEESRGSAYKIINIPSTITSFIKEVPLKILILAISKAPLIVIFSKALPIVVFTKVNYISIGTSPFSEKQTCRKTRFQWP